MRVRMEDWSPAWLQRCHVHIWWDGREIKWVLGRRSVPKLPISQPQGSESGSGSLDSEVLNKNRTYAGEVPRPMLPVSLSLLSRRNSTRFLSQVWTLHREKKLPWGPIKEKVMGCSFFLFPRNPVSPMVWQLEKHMQSRLPFLAECPAAVCLKS